MKNLTIEEELNDQALKLAHKGFNKMQDVVGHLTNTNDLLKITIF